ncbi:MULTISPECIES: hypothetical protein [Prochlorococcus]|uniref:hypothetical protein n=1 Tax=Prochlorococcus TaxID=1218 RepID=UPI0007B3D983|nr:MULTISPECIES: hypothetical protein [Prochlorococcus]KZR62591.1 hypothetical protein PMIT1312_02057 [Prochlorococcus marinus str. MIT 1312]KZR80927.1 hypothetical protein PMIT1327_01375 [Prochlorococcus marinus str. MIT 1327]NMO84151.1 hypothetical protein [Prochlorococcus sp. P1344]NMP05561.1 hypothetical protein [Prochlorococcus sp. P1361]NMP12511.1 hypothetical protein [Prochlorococcus sp.P1363]
MTDPKENEDIELSTDELKSVSGGWSWTMDQEGSAYREVQSERPFDPRGSGSGMTKGDWEKRNKTFGDGDGKHELSDSPNVIFNDGTVRF